MIRKDDIRKINTTGGSETYFVTIPKDIIRHLNWRKGQRVIVQLRGKAVTIKDYQP
ncbi:MAG: AbrB/MazE/SpoVT family DNA-binding domain-containing protein [Candidatus Omnitrophica bacterium]|nr:AbrB/MazE/SpoVT family DNA-binding domain-containing protein [Candidatus Omnitrophota bacterium]